jgi:hypothetical protein
MSAAVDESTYVPIRTTASDPLAEARQLIDLGCPVFIAKPNPSYDPSDDKSKEFWYPTGWQETRPDHSLLAAWKLGDALCMVAGHGFDVVDVDTKNGANVAEIRARLHALDVEIFAEVQTPSGGAHFYVCSTGIRKKAIKSAGIDFQGRGLDGTGTGFVFLPGTLRPKYPQRGYTWVRSISPDALDELNRHATGDQIEAIAAFLIGIGGDVSTAAEESIDLVGGEPIEQMPDELRELIANIGPESEPGNRSHRFHDLVKACRLSGLTQGQTVTALEPWCNAVGKYVGKVAVEVGRSWPKVEPLPIWVPPTDLTDEQLRDQWVRKTFPLLDWADLWADETEQEWIAEPLLPARRLVALYSAPKVGKSLLMLEIAAGIAAGFPLFGTQRTKQARVLYVDFENDPRGDVRERLRNMGYTPQHLENLCYLSFPTMAGLDSERGSLELLTTAQTYECDVVVIDTVSRSVSGEENENDTWLNFYRHTGLKLKQAGMSMIRLDHSGKDESKGQRGGSAKSGDVDAVWRLTKRGDDLIELFCEANRFPIARNQITLRREDDPLRHVIQDDPGLARRTWIFNELTRAGVPKGPKQITIIELREMLKRHGLPKLAEQKGQGIKKQEWITWCDEPGAIALDLTGHGE